MTRIVTLAIFSPSPSPPLPPRSLVQCLIWRRLIPAKGKSRAPSFPNPGALSQQRAARQPLSQEWRPSEESFASPVVVTLSCHNLAILHTEEHITNTQGKFKALKCYKRFCKVQTTQEMGQQRDAERFY